MQPNNSANTLAANTTGAPMEMYTATFGNVNFQIQPSMTGEVSNTFGIVPYVSVESIIYAQGASSQVSPVNLLSGQNSGQQNIQGQYTVQDSNGLTRMVMGYSPGGF
jgi:hypothetical protein